MLYQGSLGLYCVKPDISCKRVCLSVAYLSVLITAPETSLNCVSQTQELCYNGNSGSDKAQTNVFECL